MITAVGWVRRGVAKRNPTKFSPSPDQLQQLQANAEQDLQDFEMKEDEGGWEDAEESSDSEDNEEDVENAMELSESAESSTIASISSDNEANKSAKNKKKSKKTADDFQKMDSDEEDDLAKYNLNNYDEEPSGLRLFGSLRGLQYFKSNDEDPFITLKDEADSDPEDDDLTIEPTDSIILAAKTEDDLSHLEVYVFEEEEDNLFIHHDVMLPSYPLCLEWMNFDTQSANQPGNFVAMGTFQPEIEIWNLDVVDTLFPHAVLGKNPNGDTGVRKKKLKKNPDYHMDAVLGISWNKNHRNILASASADATIKLWDLSKLSAVRSLEHHKDKVQAVAWNPVEATVLLSGAYDKTVAALDVRAPNNISSWNLTADIECAKWNPFSPQYFLASTEDGLITCYDARKPGNYSLFTLQAHDEATCAMDFNPLIPDCLVTASFDKTVKIWDLTELRPALVHTRDMGMGKLFAASFCPDSPFVVAVAGGKGKVETWNSGEITAVRSRFEKRITQPPSTAVTEGLSLSST